MQIVISVIIAIAAVLAAGLIQNLINVRRIYRSRQFVMPILSVVYDAAAIVTLVIKYKELLEYLNNELGIDSLSKVIGFDPTLLVLNLLCILGFLGVKILLIAVVVPFLGNKKLLSVVAGFCYEYSEDYSIWFLKKKWSNYRGVLLAVVISGSIVTAVFCGLSILPKLNYGDTLLFPAAVLIVINEIYAFFNGMTYEEFRHDIYGDEQDSRRISHFYKVREIYEKLLPMNILSSHTGCEFMSKQPTIDLLKSLEQSGDDKDKLLSAYLSNAGEESTIEADYVVGIRKMLHHQNVIFLNPFYRDLSTYITLPLIDTLFSGKKCLVVVGRHSVCPDSKKWVEDMLVDYTHISSLWRTGFLNDEYPDLEVGILPVSKLYDSYVISANKEFFEQTSLVILLEPSIMLTTGQIGLSILASEVNKGEKPVFCVCDRKADGLVDTVSHLLHAEFTDVIAMPVPRCIYTGMTWNVDGDYKRSVFFDKQIKFLGNGMELAAIAVKNQVSEVTWFSEKRVPVRDVEWIAGQYYGTICRYMNLPMHQKELSEKVHFNSNLWDIPRQRESFVVVNDEFNNAFLTLRTYLSRGVDQAFINVVSENYLLRDYMRCNKNMFTSDPCAVPSVVPDYAKTERNVILQLILTMVYHPIAEGEIERELSLAGIECEDTLVTLSDLLRKYTYADPSIFSISIENMVNETISAFSSNSFSVNRAEYERYFSDSLKNAFYVVEDEAGNKDFIDAKLFGHVTQTILPGQFVTYDGKYYQVKYVDSKIGVILRRASGHFDGLMYYRQIRHYSFDENGVNEIASIHTVSDIEYAFIRKDITVATTGYIEMNDNHDLRKAKIVDFTEDPSTPNYVRRFHNKNVFRIKLPETTEETRFTFCMLLSEIFRSVFPDSWGYLAVVTRLSDEVEGMLNYVLYDFNCPEDDEYVYIIEDSDLDIGLLEAVEKNFDNLMKIMEDYIEWHFEKMREPENEDPIFNRADIETARKRRRKKLNLLQRIALLFTRKREEEIELDPEKIPDPETAKTAETEKVEVMAGNAPAKNVAAGSYRPSDSEAPELSHVDGTDIFDEGHNPDDEFYIESEFERIGIKPIIPTRYQNECYLKFGFEDIDPRIKLEEVRAFLRVRGWSNNSLTFARKNSANYQPLDLDAENCCDFCSLPLSGVSYDVLNDGRVRCNNCTGTAIKTLEDFREIFYKVLEMMETFYGVTFKVPISVQMADAKTVAKGVGSVFKPSRRHASRVLGYARRRGHKYSIVIENGSPRLATIYTMVHELTHIWQYLSWNKFDVRSYFPTKNEIDALYEGMACWAAIQYLYQMGENFYASQQEELLNRRNDVYGIGFRAFCETYPIIKDSAIIKYSPFNYFPPIDEIEGI